MLTIWWTITFFMPLVVQAPYYFTYFKTQFILCVSDYYPKKTFFSQWMMHFCCNTVQTIVIVTILDFHKWKHSEIYLKRKLISCRKTQFDNSLLSKLKTFLKTHIMLNKIRNPPPLLWDCVKPILYWRVISNVFWSDC